MNEKENEKDSNRKCFNNWPSICFNNIHCPKVFSSNSVTVRMSAEDFFGQKYENYAKNLMENRRNEKNIVNVLLNNQVTKQNIKTSKLSNPSKTINNQHHNDVITKVNKAPLTTDLLDSLEHYKPLNDATDFPNKQNVKPQVNNHKDSRCYQSPQLAIHNGRDILDDISNVCSNIYPKNSNNKNGLPHSSNIVPNRIKTNGSLSREKLSSCHRELLDHAEHASEGASNLENNMNCASSDYGNNSLECCTVKFSCDKFVSRFPPHSFRNKIRTTCSSPKKHSSIQNNLQNFEDANDLDNLMKSFEEKVYGDLPLSQAIYNYNENEISDWEEKLERKFNKNSINCVVSTQKINLKTTPYSNGINAASLQIHDDVNLLKYIQNDLLYRIYALKNHISNLQKTQSEIWNQPSSILFHFFRMYERKKALDKQLQNLKEKIHRLEAQHSATKVIEENKQAKLKYIIVMKQDQITRLKEMLEHNPHDEYLKMELHKMRDTLESDQKMFEDLEFQYLEEEADWDSYRDELNAEEQTLLLKQQENHHDMEYMWSKISKNASYLCLLDQLPLNDVFNGKMPENILSISNQSKENLYLENVSNAIDNRSKIRAQVLFNDLELDLELLPLNTHISYIKKSKDEHKANNDNIEISIKKCENPPSLQNANIELFNGVSVIKDGEEVEAKQQFLTADEFLKHKATTEAMTSPNCSITDAAIKSKETVNALEGFHKVVEFKPVDKNNYHEGDPDLHSDKAIMTKLNDRNHSKSLDALQQNFSNHLTDDNDNEKSPDSNSTLTQSLKHSTNFNTSLIALSSTKIDSCGRLLNTSLTQNQTDTAGDDVSLYNLKSNENADCNNQSKRVLSRHQRPLTRYLPIFSSDLNLREHIESAGHQVPWCPHVFIDCHSCRGYLYKLGATFHTWSKRWFVLDREKCIFAYYSNKMEGKPKGGEYFSGIEEVYLDHLNVSKSNRPDCTFIVKTRKRYYHLQASSSATARIWIDAIITGAQANVEY